MDNQEFPFVEQLELRLGNRPWDSSLVIIPSVKRESDVVLLQNPPPFLSCLKTNMIRNQTSNIQEHNSTKLLIALS